MTEQPTNPQTQSQAFDRKVRFGETSYPAKPEELIQPIYSEERLAELADAELVDAEAESEFADNLDNLGNPDNLDNQLDLAPPSYDDVYGDTPLANSGPKIPEPVDNPSNPSNQPLATPKVVTQFRETANRAGRRPQPSAAAKRLWAQAKKVTRKLNNEEIRLEQAKLTQSEAELAIQSLTPQQAILEQKIKLMKLYPGWACEIEAVSDTEAEEVNELAEWLPVHNLTFVPNLLTDTDEVDNLFM